MGNYSCQSVEGPLVQKPNFYIESVRLNFDLFKIQIWKKKNVKVLPHVSAWFRLNSYGHPKPKCKRDGSRAERQGDIASLDV